MKTEKIEIDKGFKIICEQTGKAEDMIKEKWVDLFGKLNTIEKAYLIRVNYGNSMAVSVCLCLKVNAGFSEDTIKKISLIFSNMFKKEYCLDILVINDEQEKHVENFANPFFVVDE